MNEGIFCLTTLVNIDTQRRYTTSRHNQDCTEIVAIHSVLVDKYYTKLSFF